MGIVDDPYAILSASEPESFRPALKVLVEVLVFINVQMCCLVVQVCIFTDMFKIGVK